MRLLASTSLGLLALLTACTTAETASDTVASSPETVVPASVYGDETLSPEAARLDRQQLLDDMRILAADDMEGRGTTSPGNARARAYIISRFEGIGIEMIGESYEHGFEYPGRRDSSMVYAGTNIVGRIEGTGNSERVMVITAHYDHLGVRGDDIYNGADDNASGIAAMLATAADFIANPPTHDVIVVAFDAEERNLNGARAFVANPPIDLANMTFNLNLDMVAMSDDRLLWAVGTYHYPYLNSLVETVAETAPVNLPMGYDEPSDEPGGDWTLLTDSGAFFEAGIPNIYLGVDFHPHYHGPTDTYENMTLDFFQDASMTIVDFAREAERRLDDIGDAAGR
jgi:Zn-dependent M28 family amino/carboxypeptidase